MLMNQEITSGDLNEKELATFVTISLRNLPAQLYHACLNAADEAELIVRST